MLPHLIDLMCNISLELALLWLCHLSPFCGRESYSSTGPAEPVVCFAWHRILKTASWKVVRRFNSDIICETAGVNEALLRLLLFFENNSMTVHNNITLYGDTYVKVATRKTDLVTFYTDIKHTMGVVLLRLRNWKYYGHPFKIESMVSGRRKNIRLLP